MAQPFTSDTFAVTSGILAFPDHYVAKAVTIASNDANAVTRGSAKVVPAGTVWPSNDANAQGIVLNDAFITNGDVSSAIVIHGFIRKSALVVGTKKDSFTGDGATVDFTLSDTPTEVTEVKVDGTATTAYTVSGNVITFDNAPANGKAIEVSYSMTGATAEARAVLPQISFI